MKIKSINTLTQREYVENRDFIPHIYERWWIMPDRIVRYKTIYNTVNIQNALSFYTFGNKSVHVRPVLRISDHDADKLQPGEKITYAGFSWTMLKDGVAICDKTIGRSSYNEKPDSYEVSDLKKFIDDWAATNNIVFE